MNYSAADEIRPSRVGARSRVPSPDRLGCLGSEPEPQIASQIVDRKIELDGMQAEAVRTGITSLIDLADRRATDPKAARELPNAMQSLRSKKGGR